MIFLTDIRLSNKPLIQTRFIEDAFQTQEGTESILLTLQNKSVTCTFWRVKNQRLLSISDSFSNQH